MGSEPALIIPLPHCTCEGNCPAFRTAHTTKHTSPFLLHYDHDARFGLTLDSIIENSFVTLR